MTLQRKFTNKKNPRNKTMHVIVQPIKMQMNSYKEIDIYILDYKNKTDDNNQ